MTLPDPILTTHHGEFKVPGGKLVVVDLALHDGRFCNVRISGDFFLEPPEALDAINAALVGLPSTTSTEDISEAVARALPSDAEMFGFSPHAIAVTVQRAIA